MSEKLDRTPVEGYGNECCATIGCETCYRVEFDREVTEEDGTTRTERYYVDATAEMTAHLATCKPYQDELAAKAAAAEAAKPVHLSLEPGFIMADGKSVSVARYRSSVPLFFVYAGRVLRDEPTNGFVELAITSTTPGAYQVQVHDGKSVLDSATLMVVG